MGNTIGDIWPSKEGNQVWAGKYGWVSEEEYNQHLQSGAVARGQQEFEEVTGHLMRSASTIYNKVGEYIPDIELNQDTKKNLSTAKNIAGHVYNWTARNTVEQTLSILGAPVEVAHWTSRKLDPTGRGIGRGPLSIAETAVTLGGPTLLKGGRAAVGATDDLLRAVSKADQLVPVPVTGILSEGIEASLSKGNAPLVSSMFASKTLTKTASSGGLPVDDPAFKIRELDALKATERVSESKRIKGLIESAQLKPPPPYKLKTSAEAEAYYGLTSKELKEQFGLRYNQYGSSRSGDFKLKSLKLNQIEIDKRNLSIINVTESAAVNSVGKRKWNYINKKLGMEAHHIIPIHVSTKLKDLYLFTKTGKPIPGGLARWKARLKSDAKLGIYHGNHENNIVAVRGSTRTPLTKAGQRSEIYHREGFPELDNLGYHNIEGSIKWDTTVPDLIDLTPYRDIMAKQTKLRNQADKVIRDVRSGKIKINR